MHNPLDLSGKLVLVTGASSGIGRATAVVLSRMGARLILSGRRTEALYETLAATENPEIHLCSTFDLANLDGIPLWWRRWLAMLVCRLTVPSIVPVSAAESRCGLLQTVISTR